MEEFLQDDPAPTASTLASWLARQAERDAYLVRERARELDLRGRTAAENSQQAIIDPSVQKFLDIGNEPFEDARQRAHEMLVNFDEANIVLPPATTR
jgi:hypothetical protein